MPLSLIALASILLFGTIGLVAGGLCILWLLGTIVENIEEKKFEKTLDK